MKYGIFCSVDGENRFLDESSELVKFKLKKTNELYSLEFWNVSGKEIKIYSAMLELFLTGNKVLEHGWLQCSDAYFRDAGECTKKNKLFLRRDQNPFSFKEEYGYLKDSIVSEWFTVIKGEKVHLIGAVTTKSQFTQIFVKKEKINLKIRITCQFDCMNLLKNDVFKTETIAILSGEEDKLRFRFNSLIKKHMHIKKKQIQISGVCCAYYWNAKSVDEFICNEELDSLKDRNLKVDYFQIDDGYTKVGDWLEYKKKFPAGFMPIIKKAKKYGIKPGIWISPFIAQHDSNLFKLHPEWFIKQDGKYLGLETSPFDFIPMLDFKVIDPTNKEFRIYLKKVLTHFKKLGFELFKIDFLSSIGLVTYKNTTRAKVLNESMYSIRKILGEEIHILSGISQLSPLVGIVDSARLGLDTLFPKISKIPLLNKVNDYMLSKNLRGCTERKDFDFWGKDPDIISFQSKDRLRNNQLDFIKKQNANFWIGDRISRLNKIQVKELNNIKP